MSDPGTKKETIEPISAGNPDREEEGASNTNRRQHANQNTDRQSQRETLD